jgi:hypothetical protein
VAKKGGNRPTTAIEKVRIVTLGFSHGATENGPWTMDNYQTFASCVYV